MTKTYVVDETVQALKEARAQKGLSQRALAKLADVPQSHISKIESGAVDLRLSSLVEIARVLDLEVMLVPRKVVPAVKSIVRGTSGSGVAVAQPAIKALARLQENVRLALNEYPEVKEFAQLQRQLRDLRALHIPSQDMMDALRQVNTAVQAFNQSTSGFDALHTALSTVQSLRNTAVHATPRLERAKPAYSLEEDDDHG